MLELSSDSIPQCKIEQPEIIAVHKYPVFVQLKTPFFGVFVGGNADSQRTRNKSENTVLGSDTSCEKHIDSLIHHKFQNTSLFSKDDNDTPKISKQFVFRSLRTEKQLRGLSS